MAEYFFLFLFKVLLIYLRKRNHDVGDRGQETSTLPTEQEAH